MRAHAWQEDLFHACVCVCATVSPAPFAHGVVPVIPSARVQNQTVVALGGGMTLQIVWRPVFAAIALLYLGDSRLGRPRGEGRLLGTAGRGACGHLGASGRAGRPDRSAAHAYWIRRVTMNAWQHGLLGRCLRVCAQATATLADGVLLTHTLVMQESFRGVVPLGTDRGFYYIGDIRRMSVSLTEDGVVNWSTEVRTERGNLHAEPRRTLPADAPDDVHALAAALEQVVAGLLQSGQQSDA